MADRPVVVLRRRSLVLVAAVVVVLCVGGSAAVVSAGGGFTDVGAGHPFRNEILAIRNAGITTGFSDGTYRPGAPVSRGAMAAFMGRGFGRVDGDSDGLLAVGVFPTLTTLATAEIAAGATELGGGYVLVTAQASFAVDPATNCPCPIAIVVTGPGGETRLGGQTVVSNDDTGPENIGRESLSVTEVFPLDADEVASFTLKGATSDPDGPVEAEGTITALYVPFDGTGNQAA
jgi:hypothetical protein